MWLILNYSGLEGKFYDFRTRGGLPEDWIQIYRTQSDPCIRQKGIILHH
jgi:hypothetical protein